MPKVLILSDSHGWSKEILEVKERHQGEVDQIIHCGDSELNYGDEVLQGIQIVAGNTDFDPEFPNELVFDVKGTTFYVVHGHMHNIKETLEDRKSTRLNSSHVAISYAVFCLKKKKKKNINITRGRTYDKKKEK